MKKEKTTTCHSHLELMIFTMFVYIGIVIYAGALSVALKNHVLPLTIVAGIALTALIIYMFFIQYRMVKFSKNKINTLMFWVYNIFLFVFIMSACAITMLKEMEIIKFYNYSDTYKLTWTIFGISIALMVFLLQRVISSNKVNISKEQVFFSLIPACCDLLILSIGTVLNVFLGNGDTNYNFTFSSFSFLLTITNTIVYLTYSLYLITASIKEQK